MTRTHDRSGWVVRAASIALVACLSASAPGHPEHVHGSVEHVPSASATALEARLALAPDNPVLLGSLGGVRLSAARRSGRHQAYDGAHECFDWLVTLEPSSVTGRVGRAYSALGTHRFDAALEDARVAAMIEPGSDAVRALLADVHLALGNLPEAEALASDLVGSSLTLGTLARVALIAFERGETESARRWMSDALEAGRLLDAPGPPLAWCETMLGDIELQAGATVAAATHYRAALQIDPGSHASAVGLARSIATRDAAGLDDAIELLSVVEQDCTLPLVRLTLASLLDARGSAADLDRAGALVGAVESVLTAEVEAGDEAHARDLVELWCRFGGDSERAVALALREVETVRRDRDAYVVAAWALLLADEAERALPYAERALVMAPGDLRTRVRCGVVLRENGRNARAHALLAGWADRGAALDPVTRRRAGEACAALGIGLGAGQGGARGE